MKKNVFLIFLIIIAFSCDTQKHKEQRQKKIDSLQQVIAFQKGSIEEKENFIQELDKLNNSKSKEAKKLSQEKDSIENLIKLSNYIDATSPNNVFKDYYAEIDYAEIDYEEKVSDKYYKRGVYYTSKESGEYFYNVRTSIIDGQLRFYFIGVKPSKEDDILLATIYELDENKELYVIDTINVSEGSVYSKKDEEAEIHAKDCMLLQLANLIVKDGSLYYFKNNNKLNNEDVTKREFYKYAIGTKNKSEKVNNYILSNVITMGGYERKIISPDKTKFVITYFSDNFSLFKIKDWNAVSSSIFTKSFYNKDYKVNNKDNISEVSFDFKSKFYFTEGEMYMMDKETDKSIFIGGICWHTTKNVLYFDNSGIDMRCIWKVDFNTNSITKIVPEHEAIHPYFFETYDKEYIAYVEENKIMLCESPSNDNN